MTKLKSLMLPLAVLSLLLAAMIAKALAADDKPKYLADGLLFIPPSEPTPVAKAADELKISDAAVAKATADEKRTLSELETARKKHDDALTAMDAATASRFAIHKKIGELLGIVKPEAKAPESKPTPAPPAPIRIEREAEAAKPKTRIGVYTGANCPYCERLKAAMLAHPGELANYDVRYVDDNTGHSIPYTCVYAPGKTGQMVPGYPGWDAWIASVRNFER